ncbi:NADH-quinone oxidoreductase subunit NuoG [uncultured Nevskia sp.]|uniref:NADH-quinone oxidoreductase subunit NuoG n=1 Tax=uncultured Nevskia sp. TaxID=228950 RepID=UPI0025F5496E|nr:NADH-quinone oxidoreductase subunit NuoG [uncultured Nevskia sp.]
MAIIHVDGKEFTVDGADNLLQACLSLGLDIPYFCWHPALGSVGSCRQCAVKQYRDVNDTVGRIVMSCMSPASDGTYITIDDAESKSFRESVVEWLMSNHPHDCPVCEEGGHCHLQDMTVMTGHAARTYRFTKRTHNNQDLGPFIGHEMNRCIACYRCVRYYKDYAGGKDLGVYGSASRVYFGRAEDGVLESEFSGNLTEVCPTGVFTDKTHSERYNRKWDMQFAPSICQGCSVGCNISPGERYGELRRIENRYNGTVNHYFLCDRGRFGYGYVNNKDRPRQPMLKRDGQFATISPDEALLNAANLLKTAKGVVGIGSPRASLESNFALRQLVGAGNYFDGHAAAEGVLVKRIAEVLRTGPVPTGSLRGIESADAAFVLGEDVMNTAARVAMALRQVARGRATQMAAEKHIPEWQAIAIADIGQHHKHPIFIATPDATRIDELAKETVRAAPADLARLGYAVANIIDPASPAVAGLDAATTERAQRIADSLLASTKAVIVSGTGAGSESVINAAANVAWALHARGKIVELMLIVPEANSLGTALMAAPSIDEAFKAIESGKADTLVVLENDLYRRAPKARVDAVLAKAKLIVVDHQMTETAERAELLLSAGSFAEADGTLVSNEGRAQRYFQVYDPAYYKPETKIRESWNWLHGVRAQQLGASPVWEQLDHATAEVAAVLPVLAGIVHAAPSAKFRIGGLKIAREPHRYSGRTAMRANLSVHEPRQPQDADTALTFSMEGHNGVQAGERPAALTPFAWAPGWNSPQSWNKYQDEVGGHSLGGDAGVRLIEPAANAPKVPAYANHVPEAFKARAGEFLVVASQHLFGSEELSAKAVPMQSRIPAAHVALNAADAEALGLADGSMVDVQIDGLTVRLPLQRRAELAAGTLAMPILPGVPFTVTGGNAKISGAARA